VHDGVEAGLAEELGEGRAVADVALDGAGGAAGERGELLT
jgi:hypothetical protein